jgi:hypothetical protein
MRACVALLLLLSGCYGGAKIAGGEGEMSKLYGRVWELPIRVARRPPRHHARRREDDGELRTGRTDRRLRRGEPLRGRLQTIADGKFAWASLGVVGERKKGAPELVEKELNFLEALRKTNMLIIGRRSLVLQRDDGSTVLTFTEQGF